MPMSRRIQIRPRAARALALEYEVRRCRARRRRRPPMIRRRGPSIFPAYASLRHNLDPPCRHADTANAVLQPAQPQSGLCTLRLRPRIASLLASVSASATLLRTRCFAGVPGICASTPGSSQPSPCLTRHARTATWSAYTKRHRSQNPGVAASAARCAPNSRRRTRTPSKRVRSAYFDCVSPHLPSPNPANVPSPSIPSKSVKI